MPDDDTSSEYEPVACRFYDELGLRMLRGQPCTLIIDPGSAPVQTVEARIDAIATEGDEEFVHLSDGSRVRLDRIRRVDDIDRPGAC